MRRGNVIVVLGCVVAVGVLLGACRENEQDRVLLYQKGNYLGKPVTAVSEGTLRALSAQIQRQNERAGPAGGSYFGSAPPPEGVLRQRARRQN